MKTAAGFVLLLVLLVSALPLALGSLVVAAVLAFPLGECCLAAWHVRWQLAAVIAGVGLIWWMS